MVSDVPVGSLLYVVKINLFIVFLCLSFIDFYLIESELCHGELLVPGADRRRLQVGTGGWRGVVRLHAIQVIIGHWHA